MKASEDFSLEAVKAFMEAHGGRVTNHELVKHFKFWLSDPSSKEMARTLFKEYVNSLATITTINSEKYLVLKDFKSYSNTTESKESSLLNEILTDCRKPSKSSESSLERTAPPYRAPPIPRVLDIPSDYGLPLPPLLPPRTRQMSFTPPLPNKPPSFPSSTSSSSSLTHSKSIDSNRNFKLSSSLSNVDYGSNSVSNSSLISNDDSKGNQNGFSSSFNNQSKSSSFCSDKSEFESSISNSDSKREEERKISVKERTKTFNRLASEVELNSSKMVGVSGAAIKRRNSRAERGSSTLGKEDEESSIDSHSINTLDTTLKQWMIKCCNGDIIGMFKMLQEEPRLAKRKDFTNGYSALHWASKIGNLNMVKMLCGNTNVDVNGRSHGGYTPLHMAIQFGNQEVFDLLVKAYGADPHLRDYSGKKPRQYMTSSDAHGSSLTLSSSTLQQLKDRRRVRRHTLEKNAGILRFGSLSVKVKRTTEAFNNIFYHSEKKNLMDDAERMPPPQFNSIKKRKSKKPLDFVKVKSLPRTPSDSSLKEEDSDSEYGFDSQWN